jgi:nucleoid-associated protein YgaU
MNQLGKNLVLSLCVVATLLVILGLKRKFSGGGAASLLSQPSEDVEIAAPNSPKNSPRPRVLQAEPVTQHDREILSPTSPQYLDSAFEPSPASGRPVAPPELVPVGVTTGAPVTGSVGDERPAATAVIETPTAPAESRSVPEFVLTDAEDSFWSISEKVYGTGAYYRALFRHNEAKVLRPDQLRAGIEVRTPPLEVLREKYPADFPRDPLPAP